MLEKREIQEKNDDYHRNQERNTSSEHAERGVSQTEQRRTQPNDQAWYYR